MLLVREPLLEVDPAGNRSPDLEVLLPLFLVHLLVNHFSQFQQYFVTRSNGVVKVRESTDSGRLFFFDLLVGFLGLK